MPKVPRSPDKRLVVRDSKQTLWQAMMEGDVTSKDFTRSGHLKEDFAPSPGKEVAADKANKENKAANDAEKLAHSAHLASLRATTPFAMQERPVLPGLSRADPDKDIALELLRTELRITERSVTMMQTKLNAETNRRRVAERNERIVMKMFEGLCAHP